MRLESTTLARVLHNVKGEGERAGYPSRHLEGASRGVKIYDHGLLQRCAPSAHFLRFPRSGFSLDFHNKNRHLSRDGKSSEQFVWLNLVYCCVWVDKLSTGI